MTDTPLHRRIASVVMRVVLVPPLIAFAAFMFYLIYKIFDFLSNGVLPG